MESQGSCLQISCLEVLCLGARQPSAQNDLEVASWAPTLAAAAPDRIQPTTSPQSLKDLTAHGLCPAMSLRRHWDCSVGSTG